ncbi:hypothetical protein [Paraliomyxa miuraensis]|uniref:hypothetical protein n=1 Tax=Paraliomyxa miuraensis TaxID=376150 RepID=UPI00225B153D|nr:hypothetical protein [Paraliomyxa miuraensis]MCX4241428.1 hypothetical protein [Paraliomyxa miuraensis]
MLPDEIQISTPEGPQSITVEEFLALPLSQRVSHVLRGTARFFAGGEEIEGKKALAAVWEAKTQQEQQRQQQRQQH